MNSLTYIIGLCFISLVFGKLTETENQIEEEREEARLKRQFETTCAFYRWSHCPGKKEVHNIGEESSKDEILKELSDVDSGAIFNDLGQRVQDRSLAKGNRMGDRKPAFRKLFKFLFSKKKLQK